MQKELAGWKKRDVDKSQPVLRADNVISGLKPFKDESLPSKTPSPSQSIVSPWLCQGRCPANFKKQEIDVKTLLTLLGFTGNGEANRDIINS